MKICVINSSYEGANSAFENYDQLPDPGRYISKERHTFESRMITKANAEAEIDAACEEGFDAFFNWMWGFGHDGIAGIPAIQYLESKGVPVVANPSKFLAQTKKDLREVADGVHLRVPIDTPGKYPKIVKYEDGGGSLDLDYDSVCYSAEEVQTRMVKLEGQQSGFTPMVQDYITGKEYSVIVVEMGWEVVPLTPIAHVFSDDTPPDKAFYTWYNKFEAGKKKAWSSKIVLVHDEDEDTKDLKAAAVEAFKRLGVQGGGAWARIDMRREESTGHVYVFDVNSLPVVFYHVGNRMGDDTIVGETFPGGHVAFWDTLLATKMIHLGMYKDKDANVAKHYDNFAPSYEKTKVDTGYETHQREMIAKFDFTGTILDLGCGTGSFGRYLHEDNVKARLTGIDVSQGMLEHKDIQEHYEQPIMVGSIRELVMTAGEFDHIISFGTMSFFEPIFFNAIVARMFMLARKSITFDIDDQDDAYTSVVKSHADISYDNHVRTMDEFRIPRGWKMVLRQKKFMYKSPATGYNVFGVIYRFEKQQPRSETNETNETNGVKGSH